MDSGLKALEELKSSGTIRAYGLGVNEVPVCLEVMKRASIDCILLAGRYTLLDRTAEDELLPLCLKSNTSVVAGGVFNSGILATGAVEGAHFDYVPATEDVRSRVRALEELANANGVPLAAAAMQFPRQHPAVASVLLGTAKPSSLRRNAELTKTPVPASFYAEATTYSLVAPPLGTEAVRQ